MAAQLDSIIYRLEIIDKSGHIGILYRNDVHFCWFHTNNTLVPGQYDFCVSYSARYSCLTPCMFGMGDSGLVMFFGNDQCVNNEPRNILVAMHYDEVLNKLTQRADTSLMAMVHIDSMVAPVKIEVCYVH